MAIQSIGIAAYQNAVQQQQAARKAMQSSQSANKTEGAAGGENAFTAALKGSLEKVNNLQTQKNEMVESFASGKEQNVHELMISIQKAGLAMSMTSAVRNKIMSAYQEVMRMPF